MLIGADQFLSHFDLMRTVAIVGEKGTFKDVLAMEIAEYYLRKFGYKFFSNQRCVWNDEYWTKRYFTLDEIEELKERYRVEDGNVFVVKEQDNAFLHLLYGFEAKTQYRVKMGAADLRELAVRFGRDEAGLFERVPDITHSVLNISEGGGVFAGVEIF